MPNGEHTPPGGAAAPWALEASCSGRHQRTNEVALTAKRVAYEQQRRIDQLVGGPDGGRGRVGELEEDVREMRSDSRKTAEILADIQRSQDRHGIKLGFIVGVATVVGSAITVGLVKLLLGGV